MFGRHCLVRRSTVAWGCSILYIKLDNKSKTYWASMVESKNCVYIYHEVDFANLTDALQAGTLCSNWQLISDNNIKRVCHSKHWKSRYDRYLHKVFRTEAEICLNLDWWIQTWDGHEDSCTRRVFSSATSKATREQMRKVKYVLDSRNATIYSPVLPSQDLPNNLTVWRTNRPESSQPLGWRIRLHSKIVVHYY